MEVFSSSYIHVLLLVILLMVTGNDSAPNKPVDIYEDARQKFDKILSNIASMNEKKLKALKEYVKLDSYNAGEFLREIKNENMRLPSEDLTKAVIYETLYEVICRGSVSPEMVGFKELFKGAYKNDFLNGYLPINDYNTKDVINKVMRQKICKSIKYDHFDINEQVNENEQEYFRNENTFETNKNNTGTDYDNLNDDDRDHSDRYYDIIDYDGNDKNDDLFNDTKEKYAKVLRRSCWKEGVKNCKRACKNALRDVCDEYMCSRRMKKSFKKTCKSYCKND